MANFSLFGYGLKERASVILITIIVAGVFTVLGLYIDSLANSKPIFTFILLILSYPFCQYFLYKKFIKLSPKTEGIKQNN